jgi:dihydroflavonol-4-reductase
MTIPTVSSGLVLVTGGSGYIAQFCIAQLVQEGWRVRTTVRSLEKADQVRASIAKIGAEPASIEFVKADLNSDQGWDQAVAGADYVLHVASPVPANPTSDDELVGPARDGTLRVLKAARDAGVKRVVLTSSISAIMYGRGTRAAPFTESDWTDETNHADSSPYDRSKTLAERAAWAWHGAQDGTLELVAINPGAVLGPVVSSEFSASINIVKKLLDGSIPGLPRFGFCLVDVRDIARLHVLAMTAPSAAGQRFIGSGDFFWMKDVASVLKHGLGDKARKVPSLVLPDILVRVFAIFDPILRTRLYELGKERRVSSDKARQTLGWATRPAPESILDTARSLEAEAVVTL